MQHQITNKEIEASQDLRQGVPSYTSITGKRQSPALDLAPRDSLRYVLVPSLEDSSTSTHFWPLFQSNLCCGQSVTSNNASFSVSCSCYLIFLNKYKIVSHS